MKSLAELSDDRVLKADLEEVFAEYRQEMEAGAADAPGKNHGVFPSHSVNSPNITEWIKAAAWNR